MPGSQTYVVLVAASGFLKILTRFNQVLKDLSFLSNFKKSICPGLIFLEVLKGHLTCWDGVGSAHHRDLSQLQDFLSQRIFTVFIRFTIRFLLDPSLIIDLDAEFVQDFVAEVW